MPANLVSSALQASANRTPLRISIAAPVAGQLAVVLCVIDMAAALAVAIAKCVGA
jgi:hypothetical protein